MGSLGWKAFEGVQTFLCWEQPGSKYHSSPHLPFNNLFFKNVYFY